NPERKSEAQTPQTIHPTANQRPSPGIPPRRSPQKTKRTPTNQPPATRRAPNLRAQAFEAPATG
ncbi:MAG: hypothetical protein O2968_23815, partial [Acidobacteria bacterium]|nr:hypothetical protein [Acidobacteriota bacterium]